MTSQLSCALVSTALTLAAGPAAAQWAPWCLSESGNRGSGAVVCTFYSFAQCMESLRGIGGSCAPNPYGAPYAGEERTRQRKRSR